MSAAHEADVFGRYLLGGKMPDSKSIELYLKAAAMRKYETASAREQKILALALRHPWLVGLLDSALALSNSESLLRQKLLLMSAILETRPQYAHLFLPQRRSFFYLFYVGLVGVRAVAKAVAGKVLLMFV
ncbi:MAG: hypothetical protein ACRC3B_13830 [Bacteroidia bacterium]